MSTTIGYLRGRIQRPVGSGQPPGRDPLKVGWGSAA